MSIFGSTRPTDRSTGISRRSRRRAPSPFGRLEAPSSCGEHLPYMAGGRRSVPPPHETEGGAGALRVSQVRLRIRQHLYKTPRTASWSAGLRFCTGTSARCTARARRRGSPTATAVSSSTFCSGAPRCPPRLSMRAHGEISAHISQGPRAHADGVATVRLRDDLPEAAAR